MTNQNNCCTSYRIFDFDQRLQEINKEIQAFKKKEVMNIEELRNNVGNLSQITANLEAGITELEVRGYILFHCKNKTDVSVRQCLGLSFKLKAWEEHRYRSYEVMFQIVAGICVYHCHFYRISTRSRVCWRRSRASSQCFKV